MSGADKWRPIATAPKDGAEILCIDALGTIRVCYPKLYPRPISEGGGPDCVSAPGDRWEYFRDDVYAPGHSWSMVPVAWQPLPEPPSS